MAGKFIGENALAAVGNSYEITLIFIAFAFGCNIGCSIVVSQFFGARDYRTMKTAVYTSMISSAVICLVLMGIGIIGCEYLMRLIKTPDEVFADSKLIIQRTINGFGPGVMAGYSAAVKLNNLVITSFTTIGNGISNYAAQNIGAKKLHRIKSGFHFCKIDCGWSPAWKWYDGKIYGIDVQ